MLCLGKEILQELAGFLSFLGVGLVANLQHGIGQQLLPFRSRQSGCVEQIQQGITGRHQLAQQQLDRDRCPLTVDRRASSRNHSARDSPSRSAAFNIYGDVVTNEMAEAHAKIVRLALPRPS
jgi:hypothetical protein